MIGELVHLSCSYTPVVTDNNLIGHCSPGSGVSLLPSINRRTLFMDTTVVFLTQSQVAHHHYYHTITTITLSQCSRLRMCVTISAGMEVLLAGTVADYVLMGRRRCVERVWL